MAQSSVEPHKRRFVSLGAKLGLAVVLVVTVASAVVFAWFSQRERDSLVAAKRTAADMVADLFAASMSAPLDFRDDDGVQAELRNLRQNGDVTFAAVWLEGEIAPLAEFHVGAGKAGSAIVRDKTRTLVQPDHVETVRRVLGRSQDPVGTVAIRFSLAAENAAWEVTRVRIFWACLALALATMGLLLVVTRRYVLVPLESLLGATRQLARGERLAAIPITSHDEVGRLARAFETMHAAVLDREAELEQAHGRLRKLFDHMRQAIVVFGPDGRVEASESRQAAQVFGGDVSGRSISELLYAGVGEWDAELRAFEEWLGLAFEVETAHWPDVEALAPKEVRMTAGGVERVLTLEFRPIDDDAGGRRIMLLATDETEKSHLKRDVAEQAERHAAQMATMRRLVAGGGQQFVAFLEGARRRLAHVQGLVVEPMNLLRVHEVFQDIHTLKGEAAAFDLGELGSVASALEGLLADLRAQLEREPTRALESPELRQGVTTALDLLARAEQLFIDVSPTGRAVMDQVTVRRSDLERMCALATRQGGELGALSERVSARSLGEVIAQVAERGPGWATGAGKKARIEVTGREVLVPARLSRVLGGALAHLVRNAIAHGIETPEERVRKGKAAAGVVTVRGEVDGDALAPRIVVEDDGAGIDENPLLARAAAAGVPLDAAFAARGSFRTAATASDGSADLSGRGVGLAAVVRDLSGAGYSVRVSRRAGGGTEFRLAPSGAPPGGP